jgi:hypothetical protein
VCLTEYAANTQAELSANLVDFGTFCNVIGIRADARESESWGFQVAVGPDDPGVSVEDDD